MQACPQCGEHLGLFRDEVGTLSCDWCGYVEGQPIERAPAPEPLPDPPAPLCDPAVAAHYTSYGDDTDGIYLICEEHGQLLLGPSTTLGELVFARNEHCGGAA